VKANLKVAAICALTCACSRENTDVYAPQSSGDPRRGAQLIRQYECGVCHQIPGIRGARGQVGPPLSHQRRKVYVAGKFPNLPEVLVSWIIDAPALAPATAMPALNVTADEARDMAAYLYTLE
jgi:cytochrome c